VHAYSGQLECHYYADRGQMVFQIISTAQPVDKTGNAMLTLFRAYTTNDLSTGIYSSQEIPTLELTNYRLSSLYDACGNAGWQNVDFTARHIDWGPSWQ